ncbi:MAG: hypothetical protein ABI151_04630 [Chitinophagaceae bacterium]
MKKLLFTLMVLSFFSGFAQKIDSIYFHLYTDSLKKGTNNYINVDGKSSDGRWVPLTSKQLIFTTTGGKFQNNDLIIPIDFAEEKVTVQAALRDNPSIKKERIIYIKTLPDPELPRPGEAIGKPQSKNKNPATIGADQLMPG